MQLTSTPSHRHNMELSVGFVCWTESEKESQRAQAGKDVQPLRAAMLNRLFLERISKRLSDSQRVSGMDWISGLISDDRMRWREGRRERQEGREGGRRRNTTRMCKTKVRCMPLEQNHAGSIVPCGPRAPAVLVMSPLVAASSWWMLNTIFLFVHRVVFFNGI